uniref:t-SNARE coiled-coil homology domain-containing protein n=1 Tax=Saccharum spontaneum TaxID=62335 RepID=A0A678TAH3_SACSP|nr:hypothetical protein SS91I14_000003 [Saccharum spontaneum]
MDLAPVNEELAEIDGQIGDILRALQNGFQKLEKIKDANRRSRQLEELTDKMRDCKRLIKDFERVSKCEAGHTDPATAKMLHDRKQSMIKELNSYVALKKQQASENKRIDLFDGPSVEDGFGEENVLLASNMTNQQLMDQGNQLMDETDQAIARSKQTVQETVNVGTETAAALKAQKEPIVLLCCPVRKGKGNFGLFLLHQTEQMSRVVNELDSIHFSIKKASQLVATDRCIMAMLFLIVAGVIAVIIVKIVNPHNKDIRNIPGLAPPIVNPHNKDIRNIPGLAPPVSRRLNGFQKLEKIKDANRRSRQLEELTDKMRDCKRHIKNFERVSKDEAGHTDPATAKMLHDRKQSMCLVLNIKELNSYVALKKQQASENKRIDLFDGPSVEDGFGEENVLLASNMTNQQLMDQGNQLIDETDQAIARSKQTVQETVNVGTETAAALKAQKEPIVLLCCPVRKGKGDFGLFLLHQTEQMSRVVNELDSIHFSIKKASQLVKEISRQVATDRCIMAMLFLIVAGVIAVIIVKIVNPHNKDIRDIPGLAPPVSRRLLR